MNLSVINYPDSLGTACGYAPFSFYLGGKRTYYGLPNNPDYELGALTGSNCDSLTAVNELTVESSGILIFPNPFYNKTNITSTENINSIYVFDVSGKIILGIELDKTGLTRYELNLENLDQGIYFVQVKSKTFVETKKLIKQ